MTTPVRGLALPRATPASHTHPAADGACPSRFVRGLLVGLGLAAVPWLSVAASVVLTRR